MRRLFERLHLYWLRLQIEVLIRFVNFMTGSRYKLEEWTPSTHWLKWRERNKD